jgi:hypothetical protein
MWGDSGSVNFLVLRPAGGTAFTVVYESPLKSLTGPGVNTFADSVVVLGGDKIAFANRTPGLACYIVTGNAGDTVGFNAQPVTAGSTVNTVGPPAGCNGCQTGFRWNLGATLEPIPPLAVTTASLPDATLGSAYSASLAADGGVPPYSWSLLSGALPAGLSLSSAGVISGTPLLPGTSSFTVQVTDAESPAMSATASLSISVGGCTTTVSGTTFAPLQIGAGVTCITGATIAGPVSIAPGAVVVLTGATIYGPLTAEGAARIAVCDSSIAGPVSVSGSTGHVLIGSAGTGGSPACGGNLILGPVTLTGNSGGVEVGANTIAGPATLTGNGGPAAVVAANTVAGPLSCSANSSNPTNTGKPNTVHGPAQGQCTALG